MVKNFAVSKNLGRGIASDVSRCFNFLFEEVSFGIRSFEHNVAPDLISSAEKGGDFGLYLLCGQ